MEHYKQNEVMLALMIQLYSSSAHSFAIHTKQTDKNMCKHIHLE